MNLYEVVNGLRKESLVVACPDSPADFARRLGPPRPAALAHWPEPEALEIEQIAADMPPADAAEFVALYSPRGEGWKVLSWRP